MGDKLVFNGCPLSGSTANRPTLKAENGQPYFDTDIGQMLFYNGTAWVTSSGNSPSTPATVAATGSAIGNAAAVTAGFTFVTNADATKGVKLPATAANLQATIKNDEAANAVLKVYPPVNSSINNAAANVAYSLAANSAVTFYGYNATKWYTVPFTGS